MRIMRCVLPHAAGGDRFELQLVNAFGGYTRREVFGQWKDGGNLYSDYSYEYEVAATSDEEAARFMKLARQEGRRRDEKAVYIVIDGEAVIMESEGCED